MPADAHPGSITLAFAELRAGGPGAVDRLWQRFFPRLVAVANKTLAGYPQRVADADDAVQSAFLSFYGRAAAGEFGDLLRRDDIWRLLGVITARKAKKLARHERAAKRGGGEVLGEQELAGPDGERQLAELAATLPVQEFDLCLAECLESLDEGLRPFAVLRLLGYTNREIAQQFDCTERKVERKLNLVRLKWQREPPE